MSYSLSSSKGVLYRGLYIYRGLLQGWGTVRGRIKRDARSLDTD